MTDTPPPLPARAGHEPDDPRTTTSPRTTGAPAARTTGVPAAGPAPVAGVVRRTAREAAYLVADFPLVVAAFCIAVTAVSGSAALITLPLFVPLAGIALRAAASGERLLQRRLLDHEVPEPVYAHDYPSTGSAAGDLWRRVTDPQTWLEMVWGLVGFVLGTVTFTLTVTFGATTVAGLTSPLWFPLVHAIPGYSGIAELLDLRPAFLIDLAVHVLTGVVSIPLLLLTTRLGSMAQSTLATALIGNRGTADRYAALQHAHTAGQEAERESMRRLERDLHDGPQQGLVRLQMDLARAERLMETDPARAREILAGAGLTASSTLGELRALSRGIAPPLLVDRGLHAALQQLAASHPAQVTVRDEIGRRLPEQAETALYFAVSEGLANVAKHARASRVEVLLRTAPGAAEAVVTDDGVGGASIAKGHGLAGLQRRLDGVQGMLTVDSPEGGPTTLVARVPLAGAR